MAKEPKTYIPRAYAKEQRGNYGSFIKLSFGVAELIAFAKQHQNEKGYLNLTLSARREVGKFGDTHSLTLDTWKPTQGTAQRQSPISDEDVPRTKPVEDGQPPEEDGVPF